MAFQRKAVKRSLKHSPKQCLVNILSTEESFRKGLYIRVFKGLHVSLIVKIRTVLDNFMDETLRQ